MPIKNTITPRVSNLSWNIIGSKLFIKQLKYSFCVYIQVCLVSRLEEPRELSEKLFHLSISQMHKYFFRTRIILLHAHPQVIYSNCVKFYQYWIIHSAAFCLSELWRDNDNSKADILLYMYL